MSSSHDTLRAVWEALKFSPDNIPLGQHLADTLLYLGKPESAEPEYRQALLRKLQAMQLKIGLARAFYEQEKYSQCLVIVED